MGFDPVATKLILVPVCTRTVATLQQGGMVVLLKPCVYVRVAVVQVVVKAFDVDSTVPQLLFGPSILMSYTVPDVNPFNV